MDNINKVIKNNQIIIIIMLLAAGIRLITLGGPLYWYDEQFTALLIEQPIPLMSLAIRGDVHPPLYYYLLLGWTSIIGSGEFNTRLLSVLFGLASIFITYKIGLKIKTKEVGLIAAGIIAIIPGHIHYSQESRMYTMLLTMVGLMLLGVLQRNYKLFGIAWILGSYTHNYGLIYGLVIGFIGWVIEFINHPKQLDLTGYTDHGNLPGYEYQGYKIFRWGIMLAIVYIPWLGVMAGQVKGVSNGYWIQPFKAGNLVETAYKIIMGYTVDQTTMVIAMVVIPGLIFYLMVRAIQNKCYSLVSMIILFIAAILMIELAIKPVWLIRGFIGLLIPGSLLAASQFIRSNLTERIILIGLVIPVISLAITSYYKNIADIKGGDWAPAINMIRTRQQTDDLIIHANDNSILEFLYYYPDGNNRLFETSCYQSLGSLTRQTRQGLGIQGITPYQITQHEGRTWLVYAETAVNKLCSREEFYNLVDSLHAKNIMILRDDKILYSGVWLAEGVE